MLVAIKREFRESKEPTFLAEISDMSGVKLIGDSRPNRALVEVSEEVVQELYARFGGYCFIEPETFYEKS